MQNAKTGQLTVISCWSFWSFITRLLAEEHFVLCILVLNQENEQTKRQSLN